jgi:hypothetical protein
VTKVTYEGAFNKSVFERDDISILKHNMAGIPAAPLPLKFNDCCTLSGIKQYGEPDIYLEFDFKNCTIQWISHEAILGECSFCLFRKNESDTEIEDSATWLSCSMNANKIRDRFNIMVELAEHYEKWLIEKNTTQGQ